MEDNNIPVENRIEFDDNIPLAEQNELNENIPLENVPLVDENYNDEERRLDEEIRILQKRKKMIELMRELNVNENIPLQRAKVNFDDIQHSIVPFSGFDNYDAHKWIEDFERACDPYEIDDQQRLNFIRRLMKIGSEAETFLRIDKSITYGEFRINFLSNFSHQYSLLQIIEKLKKYKYDSSKTTVLGYALQMQEIASRTTLDDTQVIQLIIDGLDDKTPNIAILYPAQTIDELKQLMHRYKKLRDLSV